MKQKSALANFNKIGQLTTAECVFVVKKYHEIRSYRAVQEQFRQAFPCRNPPTKSTIQSNVRKYDDEGTSLNMNKGRSGRRRAARTDQNIQRVQDLLGSSKFPAEETLLVCQNQHLIGL